MNDLLPYVIAPYIRLSTEDSKVGSFSIENQRHTIGQFIDAMVSRADEKVVNDDETMRLILGMAENLTDSTAKTLILALAGAVQRQ